MIKYLVIYKEIKARIESTKYQSNEKLPDGTSLANEFGCSELTIKKALDILVQEGLIVRKRGAGSFVKSQLNSSNFKHLRGTKANAEDHGKNLDTIVVSYTIEPASEFLASRLNCQNEDMLHRVVRIRLIDNIPNAVEETYMPINVISGLSRKHIDNSIYQYITEDLQFKIHSSMINITVLDADKNDVKNLKVALGDKVVNVEQVAYLDNGEIFEYSNVKHLCEQFSFSTNFMNF